MRALCCLFFALFAAMPAISQEAEDPTKLLGITNDLLHQSYPDDCNTLRAARFSNETKNGSLESCEVKHHSKELVSGSKIRKEVAFFKDRTLIELDFYLKGRTAALGLEQAYGTPDPPVKMDSSYAFGKATYGDDGSSMTLDGQGESHFNFSYWTRPHFQIQWAFSSYMSWDDMVQRDNSILGGLLIKPDTFEKVTFTLRSDQSTPPQPPALPDGTKQAIVTNSEASKSSPAAAAALAEVGHLQTPQEMATLVQAGKASKCAVITNPPGAEIDIDGNKAGVSPMVFVLLKKGDTARVITIKMRGYRTVEKAVVPDGNIIPIGLILEKEAQ
jgi:hypothetical protein